MSLFLTQEGGLSLVAYISSNALSSNALTCGLQTWRGGGPAAPGMATAARRGAEPAGFRHPERWPRAPAPLLFPFSSPSFLSYLLFSPPLSSSLLLSPLLSSSLLFSPLLSSSLLFSPLPHLSSPLPFPFLPHSSSLMVRPPDLLTFMAGAKALESESFFSLS